MSASPTSSLVVDAGVALVTVLPHPYREHGERFWQHWLQDPRPLLAPHLWMAEVTSGLRRAVWEGILTEAEARQALAAFVRLPVTFASDRELAEQAMTWAARLNQKRAYDAFYLALAEGQGAAFWSTNRRLVNALHSQGVVWAHWIGDIEKGEDRPADKSSS